jgi:GNAT superfamily N-acetyltransferase
VEIRSCEVDDLAALEWDGEYTHDRELIRTTFELTEQQAMQMLLAERGGELAGQIWIDFVRQPGAAYIWAFRVRERWRGSGLGSRLLDEAEQLCLARGFTVAELDVQTGDAVVRAMYEHRGYVAVAIGPVLTRMRKQLR